MKAVVDTDGRIALPRAVSMQAGIQPGMVLEVRWDEGRIELSAPETPVRFEQRGGLVVAVPMVSISPLTPDQVDATIQTVRDRRFRDGLE